jgi:hypothetical protein
MISRLNAALALTHDGPPPERIVEHASYCPRERRRIERWRHHLDHTERVLAARRWYLLLCGEMRPNRTTGLIWTYPPRWTPDPKVLRTVMP